MTDNHRPAVGTAFFPELDVVPGTARAGSRQGASAGRVRSLPRRRRPAMMALAIAMAGTGIVASAALYQRADHQVPVVMVTQAVPAGAVISASDLGSTSVSLGSGIAVIPASQLRQAVGQVAAVALQPATLLSPSELTSSRPPAPGMELVPAAVRPADLPATGLAAGDRVLVVPTPAVQGQPGTAGGASSLAGPVPAAIEAVTSVPDSEGFDVVDLLVSNTDAVAVASQVSTGQFALVVTRRG
jgi:SAF domain